MIGTSLDICDDRVPFVCPNDNCSCTQFNVFFDAKNNRLYIKCKTCGSIVTTRFNCSMVSIINKNKDKILQKYKLSKKRHNVIHCVFFGRDKFKIHRNGEIKTSDILNIIKMFDCENYVIYIKNDKEFVDITSNIKFSENYEKKAFDCDIYIKELLIR